MLRYLRGGDRLVAILDFDPTRLVITGHGNLLDPGRSDPVLLCPWPAGRNSRRAESCGDTRWLIRLIRAELGSWVWDARPGVFAGEESSCTSVSEPSFSL